MSRTIKCPKCKKDVEILCPSCGSDDYATYYRDNSAFARCSDCQHEYNHVTCGECGRRIPAKEFKKSACFVATAVYEGASAPEVLTLRAFRDEVLVHSLAGRAFVHVYYATSPPIARFLKRHSHAATFVRRLLLDPLVFVIGRRNARARRDR
jgi:hypothetical protein